MGGTENIPEDHTPRKCIWKICSINSTFRNQQLVKIQIKPQKETQHQSEDKDRKLDNFWLANTLKYLMKVPDYKASGYIKNPGYSYQKEYKE